VRKAVDYYIGVGPDTIFIPASRKKLVDHFKQQDKIIKEMSGVICPNCSGRRPGEPISVDRKRMNTLATLTKAHIVENLLAENLFTKTESAQIVETLFELLKQSLENGDDVLISRFGKFCVRAKHQRRGRNPQTGEPVMLDSRKVVTFKCSGVLRDKINRAKDKQPTPGRPKK
jgi:integration host factor subunit alpha